MVYTYYLLALVLLIGSSAVNANDASVGDFSSNQQAETITTTTSTTVNNKGTPVSTAVSPSSPSYTQDVCVISSGVGAQTLQIGLSFGKTTVDETCRLLKLSRQLSDLNLKVAAASVLCSSPIVFHAMMDAKTPCPVNGLIGEKAIEYYKSEEGQRLVPDRPSVHRECEQRLRYDTTRKLYVRDKQCNND